MTKISPDVSAWMERLVAYLGPEVPPIAARILGWLLICEPPEQSAAAITAATGASRASLTTNLRFLTMAGFLTKVTKASDRTTYYRVEEGAWARVVQRQIDSIETFRSIARDGLHLVERKEGAARLEAALAVFDWMADAFRSASPIPTFRPKP